MMYIQQLNQNLFIKLITALCVAPFCASVMGLSTDGQQDMEILADTAEMDDIKKETVYRGNVIITQGSIRITGHTLTIFFDVNNDMERAVMQGNPATYRQLPDDSEVFDRASALRMEYFPQQNHVVLTSEVIVTQSGLRLSGNRVEYNTALNQAKAVSNPDGGDAQKDSRVKLLIKKKKE